MNQHDLLPITFGMNGSTYLCSQITGVLENAVPIHIGIPRTGGRSTEYLKFPYEYLLLILLSLGVTVVNFVFQTIAKEKNHKE
jgi:hypothetical protein